MVYLQLFISFFKIGLFGFGGGYAILSLIQHEIEKYGWMTSSEFTDIVAISQMTPGPIGINSATFVGYTASGSVWGSVVATTAIVLPSFIIMLILCKLYFKLQGNVYVGNVFKSLRPVIVGMIAAAALTLMNKENFIDYKSFLIFAAVIIVSYFKAHPILLIVSAGVVGYFVY